jgi:hypothetical protein
LSACSRVSELEAEQEQQRVFDERWTKHCEGAVGREVYRPPLKPTRDADEENASSNERPVEVGTENDHAAPSGVQDEGTPDEEYIEEDTDAAANSDTPNTVSEDEAGSRYLSRGHHRTRPLKKMGRCRLSGCHVLTRRWGGSQEERCLVLPCRCYMRPPAAPSLLALISEYFDVGSRKLGLRR